MAIVMVPYEKRKKKEQSRRALLTSKPLIVDLFLVHKNNKK